MAEGEQPDPFFWDGMPASAPVAVAPPPRRRRALALVACAAVLAALGAAAAVVLPGGGAGAPTRNVLLDAASVTSRIPGFKFTITETVSAAAQSAAVDVQGSFDTDPLSGSLSLTVDGQAATELLVPPYAYVRLGDAAGWDRVPVGSALSRSTPGGSLSSLDPQQMLDFLRSVGSVTTVGSETVDGAPTTHYHAVVEVGGLAAQVPQLQGTAAAQGLAALAQQLGGAGIPLDVWVDAQDRVRRLALALPLRGGSQPAQIAMTMQLYDYGPQPPASPPPADQVTDLPGLPG